MNHREIKNLEWYGVISEDGKVISHNSLVPRSTYLDKSNQVCININRKTYRIKNLVFLTYNGEWDSKHEEIVYIDGDKQNNHYTNLALVPKSNRFKLTQEVADLIRERHKAGYRKVALSKLHNISITTINKILNGKSWQC